MKHLIQMKTCKLPRQSAAAASPRPAWLGVALLLCGVLPAEEKEPLDLRRMFQEGIPHSPFIEVVYRYADALLEHGRDTHGPQATGLFLSALDRETLAPLAQRPSPPAGVEELSRPGPPEQALTGADLDLDQNLLRLLYFLKGLSGDDKYSDAAAEVLAWFLKHARSRETGLYPWGRWGCWDTLADEAVFVPASSPRHAWRPWLLWKECFELAPEETEAYLRSLSKRASSAAAAELSDARQLGFLLRAWTAAFAATGAEIFRSACERSLDAALPKLFPGDGASRVPVSSPALLSLAIDADGAARTAPEPLRMRLGRLARHLDRAFLGRPHRLKSHGGFADTSPLEENGSVTPLWGARHDRPTTARVAVLCISRYENTGDVDYRDLILAAADLYRGALPRHGVDAWPSTFGHAIQVELAAFRITADKRYFDGAFELGTTAIRRFFGAAPLPRASLETSHYESTTGPDTLVLALVDLHLTTRTITAVRAPVNSLDR